MPTMNTTTVLYFACCPAAAYVLFGEAASCIYWRRYSKAREPSTAFLESFAMATTCLTISV